MQSAELSNQIITWYGWKFGGVVKFEGSLLHNSNQHLLWFLLCTARHRLCDGGPLFLGPRQNITPVLNMF